jgi:hypothetical protein
MALRMTLCGSCGLHVSRGLPCCPRCGAPRVGSGGWRDVLRAPFRRFRRRRYAVDSSLPARPDLSILGPSRHEGRFVAEVEHLRRQPPPRAWSGGIEIDQDILKDVTETLLKLQESGCELRRIGVDHEGNTRTFIISSRVEQRSIHAVGVTLLDALRRTWEQVSGCGGDRADARTWSDRSCTTS